MAYFVAIDPAVQGYLDAVDGLSPGGRETVGSELVDDLGRNADHYLRRDPFAHESLYFRYQFVITEGRTIFDFTFVVNGTAMEVGVVNVVFVDCDIIAIE